eukprot:43426-Pelagomonas_calceolata.AAC.1
MAPQAAGVHTALSPQVSWVSTSTGQALAFLLGRYLFRPTVKVGVMEVGSALGKDVNHEGCATLI